MAKCGGQWTEVELHIKKTILKEEMNRIRGKYYCQIDLEAEGWTPPMIERSKQWARNHGTLRISEVHGEEEWSFPFEELRGTHSIHLYVCQGLLCVIKCWWVPLFDMFTLHVFGLW